MTIIICYTTVSSTVLSRMYSKHLFTSDTPQLFAKSFNKSCFQRFLRICITFIFDRFLLSYERYARSVEIDGEDAKSKVDDGPEKSDMIVKAFDSDKVESKQYENNRLNSNGTNGVKDISNED